jgi:hypothetical protein
MHKTTVTAAEAVLGSDAPPALRELLRQRLRYAVTGVSVMWFLLNLQHTTDVLMHLDFEHDFVTSSKTVGAQEGSESGGGRAGRFRCRFRFMEGAAGC